MMLSKAPEKFTTHFEYSQTLTYETQWVNEKSVHEQTQNIKEPCYNIHILQEVHTLKAPSLVCGATKEGQDGTFKS